MRKHAGISCFGIMLWELCVGRVPHGDMIPPQVRARLSFMAGYLTGSFALGLRPRRPCFSVVHEKCVFVVLMGL